ncbi:hypothetical protein ACHAWC_003771 [Mediolabrus comicus]
MVVPMIVILFFAMTAAAVVFTRRRRTASTSSDDYSNNQKKKRAHQQQLRQQQQQQAAKASFRVQKSHLMSISGRGVRRKQHKTSSKKGQYHQQKTRRFRMNREDLITGHNKNLWYHQTSSWYEKLRSFFVNILSCLLTITFGYWKPLENENNASRSTSSSSYTQSSSSSMNNTSTTKRSNNNNKTLPQGYYDNITVVGLDCEMVGGGKFGMKSLLARCSVVTLDCIPSSSSSSLSVDNQQQQKLTSLNENLVVLYDKYVIPKEKVTDYRTEFSGISKSTYTKGNNNSSNSSQSSTTTIPIVSFQTCQNEISNLFASISSKPVLIVGHALQNDFDALEISHPISLIRDTAFFVPYMRRVGNRKLYSRKLSVLSSEELGIDIQQQQQSVNDDPPLLEEESATNSNRSSSSSSSGKVMSSIQNESMIGHSSVEDAAAALRLYWHRCNEWEQSLSYPLRRSCDGSNNNNKINNDGAECCWTPLKMYLDGCNLPVTMRGVDFKELFANPPQNLINNENNITMTDKPRSFSITSRKRDNANNVHTIDWMPVFLSTLSPNAIPKLDSVSILFDGAKYRDVLKSGNINKGQHGPRIFCCEGNSTVIAEITKDGETVDDVLFERLCCSSTSGTIPQSNLQQIIPLSKAIDILSLDSSSMINSTLQTNDYLSHYVVIRRKGGGSKTHRRLFDKLNLRRPNEGALCLSGITNKLQRHSWKLARDLQRERGAEKVIECELRRRQDLRYIVVTNDVYLTERLMKSHAVMVLSFMQFSNMF